MSLTLVALIGIILGFVTMAAALLMEEESATDKMDLDGDRKVKRGKRVKMRVLKVRHLRKRAA